MDSALVSDIGNGLELEMSVNGTNVTTYYVSGDGISASPTLLITLIAVFLSPPLLVFVVICHYQIMRHWTVINEARRLRSKKESIRKRAERDEMDCEEVDSASGDVSAHYGADPPPEGVHIVVVEPVEPGANHQTV